MRLLFALILAVAAVPALAEPPELLDGGYLVDPKKCAWMAENDYLETDIFAYVKGDKLLPTEGVPCRIGFQYRHRDDLYALIICEDQSSDPVPPVHLWRITQEPDGKLFISINHQPRTRLYRESECKPPKVRG